MLLLLSNSQPLTLSNVSFNLTLASPIDGENAGSYVFSVSVPYEGNAELFGFPYRLTRLSTVKATTQGQIVYNGVHVQSGFWQAKSSNGLTIDLEMVIGNSYFNTVVDGILLPELFDTSMDIDNFPEHINETIVLGYPDVNHQFPSILNSKFFGDSNIHFSGVINLHNNEIAQTPNATAIVPQMYLLYIIKQMFATVNYKAYGQVFLDEFLQKALLYNNFAIDRGVWAGFYATVSMATITNTIIKFNDQISDPLSVYTSSEGKYHVLYQGEYNIKISLNAKPTQSNPLINKFVIVTWFGSDEINTAEFDIADLTDYHTYTNDFIYQISEDNIGFDLYTKSYFSDDNGVYYAAQCFFGVWQIQNKDMLYVDKFGDKINYKNHVPNMDVKEFFNSFCTSFKVMPFFNHLTKEVELVFLRDLLNNNKYQTLPEGLIKDSLKVYSNDYTGLEIAFDFQGPDELINENFQDPDELGGTVDSFYQLPGSGINYGTIYLVKSLNAYYKYTYIPPPEQVEGETIVLGHPEWLPWGDNHLQVILDDGKEKYNIPMAPMLMRFNYNGNVGRNLPSIEGSGTSSMYEMQSDFPLRIMFYAGLSTPIPLNTGIPAYDYPFASTTKYDTRCDEVLPMAYKIEEIITVYLQPFIAWIKRRMKVEFTNLVSPQFINMLNLQKSFLLTNAPIFISEIVVKIKNKMFGPGDFEGWTN